MAIIGVFEHEFSRLKVNLEAAEVRLQKESQKWEDEIARVQQQEMEALKQVTGCCLMGVGMAREGGGGGRDAGCNAQGRSGGGESVEPLKTWGLGKRAQLTGPSVSHYELWRHRRQ